MTSFLMFIGTAYLVLWFCAMVSVLGDRELSEITKLTWVIVLLFAPVIGLLLYAVVSPGGQDIETLQAERLRRIQRGEG
ncbi:MAG: PLDc N-terminal domain-containing protein [Puniceicoccales bacterium]